MTGKGERLEAFKRDYQERLQREAAERAAHPPAPLKNPPRYDAVWEQGLPWHRPRLRREMSKPFELRRLEKAIRFYFPPPWSVRAHTQKECAAEGCPFDPPCAYVSITCRLGAVNVCTDGEFFTSAGEHGQMPTEGRTRYEGAGRYLRAWLSVQKEDP